MTFSWFALVLFIGSILYYKFTYGNPTRKHKENKDGYLGLEAVPTIQPVFPIKFIGNLPWLLPISKALQKGMSWSNGLKSYGETMKFHVVNETFVLMNTPQLVQTLLKSSEPGHLQKSGKIYNCMKPFMKNGLLVSHGSVWQRDRKILMKSQNFQALKSYVGMVNKHSEQFAKEIEDIFKDGEEHEINELINSYFVKIISVITSGVDTDLAANSKEFLDYHHSFQIWKQALTKRISNPWLIWEPLWRLHPISKLHDKAVKELTDFSMRRIMEHNEKASKASSEDLKIKNEDKNSSQTPTSFRSILDDLFDAGLGFSHILDQINTMIFGGHETEATVIHEFCLLMCENPKIQEECQKEIDETFQDPTKTNESGYLTFETVQGDLKYLERCLQETLRLYPPGYIFFRQLGTPLNLECEDGKKKIQLPVGTTVVVFPYGMHRKPEIFPDPEKFDPDRFLPEEIAKRHPYSYIPFSVGPRNCMAQKYAMMQMKILTAYILRNFTITSKDRHENVPMLPLITITAARDYKFKFSKRETLKL